MLWFVESGKSRSTMLDVWYLSKQYAPFWHWTLLKSRLLIATKTDLWRKNFRFSRLASARANQQARFWFVTNRCGIYHTFSRSPEITWNCKGTMHCSAFTEIWCSLTGRYGSVWKRHAGESWTLKFSVLHRSGCLRMWCAQAIGRYRKAGSISMVTPPEWTSKRNGECTKGPSFRRISPWKVSRSVYNPRKPWIRSVFARNAAEYVVQSALLRGRKAPRKRIGCRWQVQNQTEVSASKDNLGRRRNRILLQGEIAATFEAMLRAKSLPNAAREKADR